MREDHARQLLALRHAVDAFWTPDANELPAYVTILLRMFGYGLDKALNEGGWRVYFDPEHRRVDIERMAA